MFFLTDSSEIRGLQIHGLLRKLAEIVNDR